MNIPKLFTLVDDPTRFENLIMDLVADCVHGIKLPYLQSYPEINDYSLLIEAQRFLQQLSEVMLELNRQDEQEIQKLLDKLSGTLTIEKHDIFTKILKLNYKGLTHHALYHQVALSKYVLVDFNWNINLTISSDKISRSQRPSIMVEFLLDSQDNSHQQKKVIFEMLKEELELFLTKLQKLQKSIGYQI